MNRKAAFLIFAIMGFLGNVRSGLALDLVTSYRFSPDVVTTEKIQALDPELLNPHRQRWVLNRKIQLKGLEAVFSRSKQSYGISATTLESTALGHIRKEGPWYRPWSEFSCRKEMDRRFATAVGARWAVDSAAKAWKELLQIEEPKLAGILQKVSAQSPEKALKKALQQYDLWLRRLEKSWQQSSLPRVDAEEWAFYLREAKVHHFCSNKAPSDLPPWSAMMEPAASWSRESDSAGVEMPLARAPAKRWNGMFSVRLNIEVGARTLNGQFLVDSGTERSVLSSSWLTGQGVLPALIELPGAPLEKVAVSAEETAAAPLGVVDRVMLSGLQLDLTDFLIYDTDLFFPPQYRTFCCDGILGADFLRKYVVEFYPGQANEIRIWSREGYRPVSIAENRKSYSGLELTEPVWIEAAVAQKGNRKGTPLSENCWVNERETVFWETGNAAALRGKTTEKQQSARKKGTLSCDGQSLLEELKLSASGSATLEAGMALLGRGAFVMDLPHGRIWFSKKGLKEPLRKNNSGLKVQFYRGQEGRYLQVAAIAPGSPAAVLRKLGLKPGMEILHVDAKPASELDIWQVEQILSGAEGSSVTLQWSVKGGVKMARFELHPS
jgi:hypothetical protein